MVRQIGVIGLALTVINLIIGVGIFGLPGVVAAELGSAAVLAYLGCGVLAGLTALCGAEAVSRVPEAGGLAAAAHAAFGPIGGSVVGNLLWFASGALASAAIAALLLDTLTVLVPALAGGAARVGALAFLYGLLAWANVRSVRQIIGAVSVVSLFKLAPLVLLVAVGVWQIEPANLAVTTVPSVGRLSAAVVVLFFAFQGAESALSTGGEVVRPARTVPLGLALGLSFVGLLYLGLQVVGQGVLGDGLAASIDAPLTAIARALWGELGVKLVLFTTIMSVIGIMIPDALVTPRALYALGLRRLLPAALGRVHPEYRTPHIAILAYSAMAFLLAASGTFRQLALFSAGGTLLMNMVTALTVLRLRRMPGYAQAPAFRIPGGALVPVLTAAAILGVIGTLAWAEIGALALLCTLAAIPALRVRRIPAPGPSPAE